MVHSKIGERGEEQGARIKKLKIIDFLVLLGYIDGSMGAIYPECAL